MRDYVGIVEKILARFESLERTRLILRTEMGIDAAETDTDRLTPWGA